MKALLTDISRKICDPLSVISNSKDATVLLLKSFRIRRSLFLITGGHHILHELIGHYPMFHRPPIKIFLPNSQKGVQLRQSKNPPLFARRRSASYWWEIWIANATVISAVFVSLVVLYFSQISSYYFHHCWQHLSGLANILVIKDVLHVHIHHHPHRYHLKLSASYWNRHIHHHQIINVWHRRWTNLQHVWNVLSSSSSRL